MPTRKISSREPAPSSRADVGSSVPTAAKAGKFVKIPGGARELEIRHRLGFNRPLFARMLVTSERNLASIEGGKRPSAAVNKSMVEVRRLYEALSEVVDPESIGEWMKTPNKSFDGLKPLEVIERGESDRIWNMIYEMRSGAIL